MDWYTYIINAAIRSKYNGTHWFRYLRKVIREDEIMLTTHDFEQLLQAAELSNFQKVSLKHAMQKGSPTHEHILSLNRPAKLKNINALMEKYHNGSSIEIVMAE